MKHRETITILQSYEPWYLWDVNNLPLHALTSRTWCSSEPCPYAFHNSFHSSFHIPFLNAWALWWFKTWLKVTHMETVSWHPCGTLQFP